MRRSDREVTSEQRIEEIIEACQIIRLGIHDEERIYIVPLHFGYERDDGGYVFYCHGASEGKKIKLLKTNGYVGFELDGGYEIIPAAVACGYSSTFYSVIGEGQVSFVEEDTEKIKALQMIMKHYTHTTDWELPLAAVKNTAVLKLVCESMTCKEHN